jgi:phosphohistidine swiveling domain-containing protein
MNFITLVERNETPLWVALVLGGCADHALFIRTHGINFQLKNYRFLAGLHQIGEDDLRGLSEAMEDHIKSSGFEYFKQYEGTCKYYCEKLEAVAKLVRSWPLPAQREELRRRLMLYLDAAYECMPFMVSIFAVQAILTKHLAHRISPVAAEMELPLESTLTLLTRPATPTAVEQDLKGVTAFAEEILSDQHLRDAFASEDTPRQLNQHYRRFLTRLRKHCRNFGWLQTFTYRNRPFALSDLIQRLRERVWRTDTDDPLRSSHLEGNIIEDQLHQIEESLDRESRYTLDTARRYATLRFYRVDVHFMTAARLTRLMGHAAEALGLPYELLCYLTPHEIDRGLQSPLSDVWQEVAGMRQKEGFDASINESGTVKISSPSQMSMPVNEGRREPLLDGTTAALGTYSGPVKVVRSLRDCAGFERGDVLVSPMTTPEFMSAIEKAGAIITDEGGLLCHAAIISRELAIPCIIGTRTASHVLRAGEHVTVKADREKGVVHRNDF